MSCLHFNIHLVHFQRPFRRINAPTKVCNYRYDTVDRRHLYSSCKRYDAWKDVNYKIRNMKANHCKPNFLSYAPKATCIQ